MNIAARAHAIIIDPPAEWAKIDGEPGDVVQLLTSYVAPLAAIPALSGFIGACLVGAVVRVWARCGRPSCKGSLARRSVT